MNVRAHGVRGWTAIAATLLLASAGPAAAAGVYHVDRNNPACTNAGPGSAAIPYCTITAASNARGGAGTTILVQPGRYREQVTVPASGLPGSPFVLQAAAPGVIIDGSDGFSSPGLWQPHAGNVFRAAGVTWLPRQVFVDGSRLTLSTETVPAAIAPGSFLAVTGEGLYVNLGGDNPGDHVVDVGRRFQGFLLNGRSWVTIRGFEVARVENRGIALNTGSNDCVVAGNTVTWNRFQGIVVSDSTRVLVDGNTVGDNADHGIYLINSAANVVRGNESYRNARPAVRAANGLALNGSTGNLLENNRLHHNQDTGMQIGAGSHDNLSRQNISWSNGDHGYDHLGSVSNQHIGDVAWGNFKDGFSQEGNAPGNLLYNCIGVDNGLTTAEFNLWVDSTSTAGFRSDHNIFWNSNGQSPVKYGATVYATLADFSAATGHDARSIQSDPRFTDPVSGLFGLLVGSPAIDSATSMAPNWPSLDAQGSPRGDEIHTPDTGIGPVAYADRGAIEFDPNDYPGFPPSASLTAQPATGSSPLLVTLDASGSSDPDGPLASWTFDFGDGSPLLSQASATAQHTYAAGSYTATVTVTDGDGLTDLASANISVNSSPTAGLTVAPSSGRAPLVVLADASGSTDIDGTIVSYTFDFGDGVIVGPQPGATASHTYAAGNWTARVTVTDDDGGQGTRTAGVIVAANQPPNGVIDAPAANLVIQIGQSVSFQGTGSDPEGDTPLTYRWQFGNAAPASTLEDPGPVTFTKQGNYKVTFTVTDSRGLADPTPASVTIFVRK